ncbi:Kiwa anti-phage protein KwaB-like domain-containing protein [Vibrio lentus]|uniref:Kiwa anti-phage protein KwaB-like domain-containing protein n=1 Tax=Vibrio lentus TaxID=136468 RepID=UPI000C8540CC|nr:Kiwa anti-phage protein KwaB-like domain-containing protein [Vibrio lentus]PMI61780.1 hypothetical protein BCU40_07865 [Vibrio lentus]
MNNAVATKHNSQSVSSITQQAQLDLRLEALKELELSDAELQIYVIKTNVKKTAANRFVEIRQLVIDSEMAKDLKGAIQECINGKDHILELPLVHTIQDNRFFQVGTSTTDFGFATEWIRNNPVLKIGKLDELHKYNSYVVRLIFKDTNNNYYNLWGYHYFSNSWSASKSPSKRIRIKDLTNGVLTASIDKSPSFTMTDKIDFIEFNGSIFIADVGKFETSMNYQERLKELNESSTNKLFASASMKASDKATFKAVISNDKHLMRQVASVGHKGHFEDPVWMEKLRTKAKQFSDWKIEFDDDKKIVIKEDKAYIKELLTLLQNKRVMTLVDGKVCDVDGELIPVV